MAPTLIAIAGPSRSGKGTCASIFTEGAQGLGLTVRERQLSGPGKQYIASAWRPEITEEEAVAWFDELKQPHRTAGPFEVSIGRFYGEEWASSESGLPGASVPLQQYLQRMLQGARDRWGGDFWTDKLLPCPPGIRDRHVGAQMLGIAREQFDGADLCLISDLRQVNEAERVKALRGYIVEMQRPEIEHSYVTGSDHVTEKRLSEIRPDLVDYVIVGHAQHNDETFDLLKSDCVKAWRNFVRPLLEEQAT
jgi:hypothetical protein